MFEPVLLNYTEEDLESLDFGMSGIVLESPLKKFMKPTNRLNETYYYRGTIKENTDWCVIEYRVGDETLREFVIQKTFIKKHTAYEKVGDNWYPKN